MHFQRARPDACPPSEVLPGGANRRLQAARRLGQPATADPLLLHRRHHPRQRRWFSIAAERALRGRRLAHPGGQTDQVTGPASNGWRARPPPFRRLGYAAKRRNVVWPFPTGSGHTHPDDSLGHPCPTATAHMMRNPLNARVCALRRGGMHVAQSVESGKSSPTTRTERSNQ